MLFVKNPEKSFGWENWCFLSLMASLSPFYHIICRTNSSSQQGRAGDRAINQEVNKSGELEKISSTQVFEVGLIFVKLECMHCPGRCSGFPRKHGWPLLISFSLFFFFLLSLLFSHKGFPRQGPFNFLQKALLHLKIKFCNDK